MPVWAKRARPHAVNTPISSARFCPIRRATAALILPCADAEAMSIHLLEIGRKVAVGARAVLMRPRRPSRIHVTVEGDVGEANGAQIFSKCFQPNRVRRGRQ